MKKKQKYNKVKNMHGILKNSWHTGVDDDYFIQFKFSLLKKLTLRPE